MADAENKNDDVEQQAADQSKTPIEETPPPRKPVQVTISDLELDQLRKESNEFKDKYQRSLAESENARKRLQKERQEMVQYAIQNVITDFINPIDHLENALKFANQASDDVKHWALGFQMILNQFKDALTSNGVVAFESEGTHFDPLRHEAVEMITTNDYPPGTIVTESLRGYKMGDRTIRPAKVTVAKAPPKETEKQAEEKDKQVEQKSNS